MSCENCGNPVEKDAKFCRVCGSPINNVSVNQEVVQSTNSDVIVDTEEKEEVVTNTIEENTIISSEEPTVEPILNEKPKKNNTAFIIILILLIIIIGGLVVFILTNNRNRELNNQTTTTTSTTTTTTTTTQVANIYRTTEINGLTINIPDGYEVQNDSEVSLINSTAKIAVYGFNTLSGSVDEIINDFENIKNNLISKGYVDPAFDKKIIKSGLDCVVVTYTYNNVNFGELYIKLAENVVLTLYIYNYDPASFEKYDSDIDIMIDKIIRNNESFTGINQIDTGSQSTNVNYNFV